MARDDTDEHFHRGNFSRRTPDRIRHCDEDFLERSQAQDTTKKICIHCISADFGDLLNLLDLPAGNRWDDPWTGTRRIYVPRCRIGWPDYRALVPPFVDQHVYAEPPPELTSRDREGLAALPCAHRWPKEFEMNKALGFLGVSMGLSFLFAVTYVIVSTFTLPQSDLAHGQMPFEDPLVFPVMSIIAGISGLIGWPLFALLGRRSDPLTVAKIAGIPTFAFIIIATPFDPGLGWLGSYFVCLAGLIFCAVKHREPTGQQGAVGNEGHHGAD